MRDDLTALAETLAAEPPDGEGFDAIHAALQASEPDVTPGVRVYVRQVRRRMLTQRIMRVLIVALVLGGLAAGVWLFRERLIQWMR
jgi:hypothetical protein